MQVSFDRAAGYYDATRALPGEVHEAVTQLLCAELVGRGTCLEIGVGTGRIALPLHQRGVRLVGADIAPAMLTKLVANAGGTLPFPLMLADATGLPLADGSLGGVFACHVLHLIDDWQGAVDEAFRVLAPGGVMLADLGFAPPIGAPWGVPIDEVLLEHGLNQIRPGVTEAAEIAAHLGDRAVARPLPAVVMTVRRSPEEFLRDLENQIYSWTWDHEPLQLRRAAARLREKAAELGITLAEPLELSRTIQWWAFDRS